MSKHILRQVDRTYTDEYGNVREETTEKEFSIKTQEDSFYMIFTDFVKWMYNITSVNALKLLPKLMELAEFNSGIISLSAGARAILIQELKLSPATFTRAINDLIQNKALHKCYMDEVDIKTGEVILDSKGNPVQKEIKGQYMVNPEMFWKGDLKKRRELRVLFKSIPEDDPAQ